MNQFQKEAFERDAKKIEDKLRGEGYLSTDIVSVAYFLLKSNLTKAELLEEKQDSIQELIKKAEELLKT